MLQPFPYDVLFHYSEKFTRDVDLRQDLVLLGWQMDVRLGEKSDIRLVKHYMKLRAKEIKSRNSLGKAIGGKSKKDIWRMERLSIHKPFPEGSLFPIADMLSCASFDPFGQTVVNDFWSALPDLEGRVAEQMVAGYSQRESVARLGITMDVFRETQQAVRDKAMEYLV